MAIPDETIQQIKAANDIIDVISQYVKLKRTAPTSPIYIGQCPFHKETDGSFKVNSQTQSWYCYGCGKGSKQDGGKGSDVIAFIMEIEEVEFHEACRILAERAGIEVTEEKPDPAVEKARQVATAHNRRYYSTLWDKSNPTAIAALDYLRSRGLTDQTIIDFRLGLVPHNELSLRNDITNIADKLAIPVIEPGKKDLKNARTLGMSYREPVPHPVSNPKYKNDSTNPGYNKGKLLYGLHDAFQEIRDKKFGIMVECYFGTMVMHQFGVKNVVSSMGTMITESQLILARRFARKWIFLYDGDDAGYNAVIRALPMMLKLNMDPWFAPLPDGDDPDEFILRIGKDKFDKWLQNNSEPFLTMFINKTLANYDNKVNELKLDAFNTLEPIMQQVSGPESKILNSMISNRLGL